MSGYPKPLALGSVRRIRRLSLLGGCLLLLLACAPPANGASPGVPFVDEKGAAPVSILSIKDGLSQTWVNDVVIDPAGYLWAGTQDGLNRFDGRFQVFRRDPQNAESLASNFVRQLTLDHSGALWIATQSRTLQRFDPVLERFESFPLPPGPGADYVAKLIPSNSGRITAVTIYQGVYSLNPETGEVLTLHAAAVPGAIPLKLPSAAVVLEHTNGQHWLANPDGALSIFDADGHLRRRHVYGQGAGSLPSGSILSMLQRKNGSTYLLHTHGVFQFDEARERFRLVHGFDAPRERGGFLGYWKLFEDSKSRLWGLLGNQILLFGDEREPIVFHCPHHAGVKANQMAAIAETPDGALWVASPGAVLHLIDEELHTLRDYQLALPLQRRAENIQIDAMVSDKNGNLWIGSAIGIIKVKRFRDVFFSLHCESDSLSALSAGSVWTLAESSDGTVWAGSSDSILNRVSPQGKVTQFSLPSFPSGRDLSTWLGPFEDRERNLWAVFRAGYISRFVVSEEKWNVPALNVRVLPETSAQATEAGHLNDPARDTDPRDDLKNASTINHEYYSISANLQQNLIVHRVESDPDNGLWLATSRGLWRLDFNRAELEQMQLSMDGKDSSFLSFRNVAVQDGETLILGTSSHLYAMNISSRTLRELSIIPEDGVPLPYHDPMAMTIVGGRIAWLGSGGNGLFRIDLQTGRSNNLTVQDGLPNSTVYAAIPDSNGNLWLPTNAGLARYNPHTGESVTFTSADGLQGNEYNEGAWSIGASGRIYVGGIDGLSRFWPARTDLISASAVPVITHFSKGNVRVNIAHKAAQTQRDVHLDWKDLLLSFEFTSLDLTDSEQLDFRYRLNGLSPEWQLAGTDRRAFYSNLEPGDYTFEVQVAGRDGKFGTSTAQLHIVKVPPPWQTWWAYVLYVLACAFLLWLWNRAQVRKLEQARAVNEQLRRVDLLKDEFLANTSHELRTPLNGIIGLAESLLDGISGPVSDEGRHNLRMIVASGKRLGGLVNDLLDFSRLKNRDLQLSFRRVSLRPVVELTLALLHPLVGQKRIRFDQDIPVDLPDVYADENRMIQILQNLIGNAIKFTDSGSICVRARTDGARVVIEVQDTGIGIPDDKYEVIFRSFEQVDGSISRAYGGTGLGLAITKQLVNLHGGTIRVHSELGAGSTFCFDLPAFGTQSETAIALDAAAYAGSARALMHEDARVPSPNARRDRLNSIREDEAETHLNSRTASGVQTANQTSSDSDPASQPMRAARILVVDDEPVNLQVLVNHLSLMHYEISVAASGADALRLLDDAAGFDLIILDVMMPRMSGLEVCRRIREKHSPGELPVIMLTARNQVGDLVDGFDAGASDYLTKPVNKHELLARTRTHLQLSRINHAYSRFVPREFLHHLELDSILDVKLGDHVKKQMTVLFSDIRAFTALSERMSPEENFRFVNAYLERMEPVIRRHGGFIDKYIGDAIMALFAEDPADAVRAAIDMMDTLRDYNEGRRRAGYETIQIGIGINTGDLMLGTVGGPDRMDGTVISDAVNLASRIEGLTKLYECSILIAGKTQDLISRDGGIGLRLIDRVRVKGRSEPVRIFEVMDGESPSVRELRLKSLALWTGGQSLYERGDFKGALDAFSACVKIDPSDGGARYYLERCNRLMTEARLPGWDGVTVMESK